MVELFLACSNGSQGNNLKKIMQVVILLVSEFPELHTSSPGVNASVNQNHL